MNQPSTMKRVFGQPTFLTAVAVLALAAVGLNAATQAMQVYFKKQAVPLRHVLDDPQNGIPTRLGDWVRVSEQTTLDADTQHVLGTDQFVFRDYVNTRLVKPEEVEQFEGKTANEQQAMLRRIQANQPEAVIRLAVTYYTGLVDTVAHVPDKCLIASGYDITHSERQDHTFTLPGGAARPVSFRYLNFEDATGKGRDGWNVAYFFHCNGEYVDHPVGVRSKLQNLFERHGYYAKVELATITPNVDEGATGDKTEATQRSLAAMTDLIGQALPDVERCLPDWAAVKAAAAGSKQ